MGSLWCTQEQVENPGVKVSWVPAGSFLLVLRLPADDDKVRDMVVMAGSHGVVLVPSWEFSSSDVEEIH